MDPSPASYTSAQQALIDIGLLTTQDIAQAKSDASEGTGVITSDTTEIAAQVKRLILWGVPVVTALGGSASVWSGLTNNISLSIGIVASTAVVVAAALLSLAQVINGDIRGRAAATTQAIAARGEVATKILAPLTPSTSVAIDVSGSDSQLTASTLLGIRAALGARTRVTTTSGNASTIKGLTWTSVAGLRVQLETDEVGLEEIVKIET